MEQKPSGPSSSYVDAQKFSRFRDEMREISRPINALKAVADDIETAWDETWHEGEEDGEDRVLSISTTELPGLGEEEPGILLISAEPEEGDRKIVHFDVFDEIEEDSEPIYMGSLAVIGDPESDTLPVIRYTLQDEVDTDSWEELTVEDFEIRDGVAKLKEIKEGEMKNLQLHALFIMLNSAGQHIEASDSYYERMEEEERLRQGDAPEEEIHEQTAGTDEETTGQSRHVGITALKEALRDRLWPKA